MWWKIYFWIILLLSIAELFIYLQYAPLSFGDTLSLFLSIVITVGVYSYVFRKSIFSSPISGILFWILLISYVEGILEVFVLPKEFVDKYLFFLKSNISVDTGTSLVGNWLFIIFLFFGAPALYSMYQLSRGSFRIERKSNPKSTVIVIALIIVGAIISFLSISPGGFISKMIIKEVPTYDTTIPMEQWSVYEGVAPKFTLKYPSDWGYENTSNLDSLLSLDFFPKDVQYAKASTIIVKVFDKEDAANLQDWVTKYATSKQSDENLGGQKFLIYSLTDMNNTVISGKKAITFNVVNPATEKSPGVIVMSDKYVFVFINFIKGDSENVRNKMIESLIY